MFHLSTIISNPFLFSNILYSLHILLLLLSNMPLNTHWVLLLPSSTNFNLVSEMFSSRSQHFPQPCSSSCKVGNLSFIRCLSAPKLEHTLPNLSPLPDDVFPFFPQNLPLSVTLVLFLFLAACSTYLLSLAALPLSVACLPLTPPTLPLPPALPLTRPVPTFHRLHYLPLSLLPLPLTACSNATDSTSLSLPSLLLPLSLQQLLSSIP